MSMTTPSVQAADGEAENVWWVLSNDSVYAYDNDWDYLEIEYLISATQLNGATFLDGYWYVAAPTAKKVYKYEENWTSTGTDYSTGAYGPTGIARNAENWWLVDGASDNVWKYDNSWSYLGETHSVNSEDISPVDIWQVDNGEWVMLGGFGNDIFQYLENWDYTGVSHNLTELAGKTSSGLFRGYGYWWIADGSTDSIFKYDDSWSFQASYYVGSEMASPFDLVVGDSPAVSTNPATNVAGTTATLNATLDLNSFQSADVYFQYRAAADSSWSQTAASAKTDNGSFSANISRLSGFTNYVFRGVAEYGLYSYGSEVGFTTDRATPPYVEPPEEEEPEPPPEAPPDEEAPPRVFTPTAPERVWYTQYMEANDRPADAPFPMLEPAYIPLFFAVTEADEDGKPFLLSSLLIMGIAAVGLIIFRPIGRWGETPENWSEGSSSGSWTHISAAAAVLVGVAAITAGWMFLRFGLSTMSITYGALSTVSVIVLVREQVPSRLGAFIGVGPDKLREAVFGGCLGVFFLFFMGWVGHWIGVGEGMSIPGGVALPLLLFGLIIPFQEELIFRGTITPTVAERWGIAAAIVVSGVAFGFVHLMFGGSWWLFTVTTIFGFIVGYFTLRQQSIVLALAAHCTYNILSFIIWVLLVG